VMERVSPRWAGATCIVAAPGPSLTPDVVQRCHGFPVVAVQDAYRMLPWADVLYGCDARWWNLHEGCPGFAGEKWSTHDGGSNKKLAEAERYGLRLVSGWANNECFSTDPAVIHYGSNSGFQAINLAIHFGPARIVLVGFDMQGTHFFGSHPKPLTNADPRRFVSFFDSAARNLPHGVEVLNATPGSALRCFPLVSLEDALSDQPKRRSSGVISTAGGPRPA
jgi:hypothetical protein